VRMMRALEYARPAGLRDRGRHRGRDRAQPRRDPHGVRSAAELRALREPAVGRRGRHRRGLEPGRPSSSSRSPSSPATGPNTRGCWPRLTRAWRHAPVCRCLLVGAFFLPRFLEVVRELSGDGQRLDNVELLQRLHELLEPTVAGLRLSNHTVHLLSHGLFTLTKMARRARAGPAGRQAEPAGLLPGRVAAAGPGGVGRPGAARGARRVGRALDRLRQGSADDEVVVAGEAPPATRRRRRSRRGRRRR